MSAGDWIVCDQCDRWLEHDIIRWLEDAGPGQCRCGMKLPPIPAAWLEENGYDVDEEYQDQEDDEEDWA